MTTCLNTQPSIYSYSQGRCKTPVASLGAGSRMIAGCERGYHGPQVIRSCAVPATETMCQQGMLHFERESFGDLCSGISCDSCSHMSLYSFSPSSLIFLITILYPVLLVSAAEAEEGVDEGYTYVIETSPDMTTCLLDKARIKDMVLKVECKGYKEWRVSVALLR